MRIALLPLDSRPCNWQFPAMIGRIAGAEVAHPDRCDLGDLHTAADTSAVAAWLEDAAPRADALVISADMLIYGGLVASRKAQVAPGQAEQQLALIKRIRQHRRVPMLIFGTIMRVAPTISSEAERTPAQDLMRLAWLSSKAQPTSDDLRAMDEFRERLPSDVVSEYQAARELHHAVNLALRDLGREHDICVLFYQDDATPEGPHVQEARAIGGAMPGTDEAGMMAVAWACNRNQGAAHFQVEYESESGAEAISLWEDRPVREVVDLHRAALCDQLARNGDANRGHPLLFVHTPSQLQTDLANTSVRQTGPRDIAQFVTRVGSALHGERPIGVADVRYCNGADPELIEAMQKRHLLSRLAAYAGWNTSGNSIGTALAHLCARTIGLGLTGRAAHLEAARAHYEFLFHRLIDDYGYQSVVRPQAKADAERRGASPLDLGEEAAAIERFVAGQLTSLAHELFANEFDGVPLLPEESDGPRIAGLSSFTVRLPWRRTFEVEVDLRFSISNK